MLRPSLSWIYGIPNSIPSTYQQLLLQQGWDNLVEEIAKYSGEHFEASPIGFRDEPSGAEPFGYVDFCDFDVVTAPTRESPQTSHSRRVRTS